MIQRLRSIPTDLRQPSTARNVTVGVIISGLAAVMVGAGATTSASAQSVSDEFNATIGETVVVTTDQNGQTTPFNLYLINGMISGQGNETVTVPTGTDSSKSYHLNNSAGQVQNFLNIAGSYSEQLPVTVTTAVTVNGQTVDPDNAYNLNGDVEIVYTMKNNTSRPQQISYTNIDGTTATETVEVPVPFGNAFSATYGDGWFITDSGKMTAHTIPGGTKISATGILFPIVPGLVGNTTQTFTLKAHAVNASLPGTTSNAIPIDLRTYDSGLLGKVGPAAQKVFTPIEGLVDSTVGEITNAANLISGYTGSFQSLNVKYIDPLVKDLSRVKVDPVVLTEEMTRLETGLKELAALLNQNKVSADTAAELMDNAAATIGTTLPELIRWLEALIKRAGPTAAQAAAALTSVNEILSGVNVNDMNAFLASDMQDWCNAVGGTSEFYGYAALLGSNPGAGALQSAITASFGANKANLKALQTALDAQAVGTIAPSQVYRLATLNRAFLISTLKTQLMKQGLPAAQAETLATDMVNTISTAGCKNSTFLIKTVVKPLAGAWATIGPKVGEITKALEDVAKLSQNPAVIKALNAISSLFVLASKVLSQPSCTNAEIVDPIVAGIKEYGVKGVEAHIAEIVGKILKNCGLSQVVAFLGNIDAVLADSFLKLAGIVGDVKSDVPKVAKAANGVSEISTVAGKAFDAIPGVGALVGDAIAGVGTDVNNAEGKIATKISTAAAKTSALINAMSDRTVAGDGAPYGNAKGVNTTTVSTYQITQMPAEPYKSSWVTAAIFALLFLVVAAGLGTYLHRRRRASVRKFVDGEIS